MVDVTNFTANTWPVGHGAPPEGAPAGALTTGHGVFHSGGLHVVERFTFVDADTIRYTATIEDPDVFTPAVDHRVRRPAAGAPRTTCCSSTPATRATAATSS